MTVFSECDSEAANDIHVAGFQLESIVESTNSFRIPAVLEMDSAEIEMNLPDAVVLSNNVLVSCQRFIVAFQLVVALAQA